MLSWSHLKFTGSHGRDYWIPWERQLSPCCYLYFLLQLQKQVFWCLTLCVFLCACVCAVTCTLVCRCTLWMSRDESDPTVSCVTPIEADVPWGQRWKLQKIMSWQTERQQTDGPLTVGSLTTPWEHKIQRAARLHHSVWFRVACHFSLVSGWVIAAVNQKPFSSGWTRNINESWTTICHST